MGLCDHCNASDEELEREHSLPFTSNVTEHSLHFRVAGQSRHFAVVTEFTPPEIQPRAFHVFSLYTMLHRGDQFLVPFILPQYTLLVQIWSSLTLVLGHASLALESHCHEEISMQHPPDHRQSLTQWIFLSPRLLPQSTSVTHCDTEKQHK